MISSYKDLLIWQKSVDFAVEVYRITKIFPQSELFGITSQLRRASVAIPSNIAEGYCRGYKKEYIQFLKVSYASGAECATQLIIAHRVGYLSATNFKRLSDQADEIMKMIYSLINKLS